MKENHILVTSVDVIICELSALVYKIDLETMELGEEQERISGNEFFMYRYIKEEKIFFDQDNNKDVTSKEWGWYEVSYEDEEYEYEDIDPQF